MNYKKSTFEFAEIYMKKRNNNILKYTSRSQGTVAFQCSQRRPINRAHVSIKKLARNFSYAQRQNEASRFACSFKVSNPSSANIRSAIQNALLASHQSDHYSKPLTTRIADRTCFINIKQHHLFHKVIKISCSNQCFQEKIDSSRHQRN